MNFRRTLFVLAVATASALSACGPIDEASPQGDTTSINAPTEEGSQRMAVVVPPIDECRFDDPNCPIDPPCDPIYDFGCQPCPQDNPEAWCYVPPCTPDQGLINTYSTFLAGVDPYASPEVNILTGDRCNRFVVTGIAVKVQSDSNYKLLWVDRREPHADGSLGPELRDTTGANSTAIPDAQGNVPYGYAIVGVGVGQAGTQSVRTLNIYYRQIALTASGVRMTGPVLTLNRGPSPYGSLDASYINYDDNKVFVGVGFRSAVQKTKTLRAYVGTLP